MLFHQVSTFMRSISWVSHPAGMFAPETATMTFQPHGSEEPVCTSMQVQPLCPSAIAAALAASLLLLYWIPIWPFQLATNIFTHASTQGYGSHMGDSQILGPSCRTFRKLHISFFKLKALQHWLQC